MDELSKEQQALLNKLEKMVKDVDGVIRIRPYSSELLSNKERASLIRAGLYTRESMPQELNREQVREDIELKVVQSYQDLARMSLDNVPSDLLKHPDREAGAYLSAHLDSIKSRLASVSNGTVLGYVSLRLSREIAPTIQSIGLDFLERGQLDRAEQFFENSSTFMREASVFETDASRLLYSFRRAGQFDGDKAVLAQSAFGLAVRDLRANKDVFDVNRVFTKRLGDIEYDRISAEDAEAYKQLTNSVSAVDKDGKLTDDEKRILLSNIRASNIQIEARAASIKDLQGQQDLQMKQVDEACGSLREAGVELSVEDCPVLPGKGGEPKVKSKSSKR